MDWLQALVLGIVQGLSEYLPVSSSGHLEIFKQILGMDMEGAESLQFDVVLHVATVLSTIVVLWREFVPLVTSFFGFKRDDNFYYVLKLLVSCVPILIVGLMFKDQIDELFNGNLLIVGICLLITAMLLSFTYFSRTEPEKVLRSEGVDYKGHDITWMDAFIIGCAQAVAVLPGLSRSGSTIATGLLLGDRRDKVAQFSFFMVVIPILGEALLDSKKILFGSESMTAAQSQSVELLPMIVGFVAAFVVGCLACRWMINLVKKGKLIWFAVYCAAAGILSILWQLTHAA
ncbi:MAG: undecaprenyl-diphosphate phosphatase [Muribaculaceae bacterium]|nr:undecaprenyl-diphosphate phosphatase [Muribaculaceae bacterium]MDE7387174.1 undecaprenyl-diphosphate phosphatase [Muribaculaceae bacterium]